MAEIKDILAFLLSEYPHDSHLSNARVTKMLYLADWHQAINYKLQISPIKWYFDNYGPFVWDVVNSARQNSDLFELQDTTNDAGYRKIQIALKNKDYTPNLTDREIVSLRHVIKETSKLSWSEFIRLIYSTYPILTGTRYTSLNLPNAADKYESLHSR